MLKLKITKLSWNLNHHMLNILKFWLLSATQAPFVDGVDLGQTA